jgi:hypothetical protein
MFLYTGNTVNTLKSVEISHFSNGGCPKAARSRRFTVSQVFFNSEITTMAEKN